MGREVRGFKPIKLDIVIYNTYNLIPSEIHLSTTYNVVRIRFYFSRTFFIHFISVCICFSSFCCCCSCCCGGI